MGKGTGVSGKRTTSDQEEEASSRYWQYLQVVKQRARNGRVIGMKVKTVYGDEQEVLELLGASTSYVERTNLTSRHMNGRLVRKTLGYSKELEMLRASSIWEDALYNLGRALKTLRVESSEEAASQRWIGRSPAMAAGLTDHIWEIKELLTTLPLPSTNT
jgi:IS1 family transposase